MANTLRIQRPKIEGNWLYQDQSEDYRYFTKFVFLGKDEPEWAECTNEEKEKWEEKHRPQPEVEEEQINKEEQL